MIRIAIRKTLAVAALSMFFFSSEAQNNPASKKDIPGIEKTPPPFKILTSGKRITVQGKNSNNNIKRILVWTSSGHRIVEQHDLDVSSYYFTVPGNERVFFLMLEMKDGKRYTEKFGVQ